MDADEERVLYLSRLGHEKIIKRGTYDIRNFRPITQDHPFYAYKTIAESEEYFKEVARREQEDSDEPIEQLQAPSDNALVADDFSQANIATDVLAESYTASDNPDALADEILSSNFKVGMSQSEVDDFLKTLLGG